MERFELTEDLITGFQDIDNHHRTILEMGNRVVDLSTIKTNSAVFEDALKYLSDFVNYHFAAEEYVMVATRYPNFDHHFQWHERFKRDIADYQNLALVHGVSQDFRVQLSFAIENWLKEHVRITDLELAKYLQQRQDDIATRLPSPHTLKEAGRLPADCVAGLTRGAASSPP